MSTGIGGDKELPANFQAAQKQAEKEVLELPGNPGLNLYAITILLGLAASLFFSLYKVIFQPELIFAFQGAGSILGIYLVGRAVFKRMPSRIEISGEIICIFDVPSFRIEVDRFYFPLFCRKSICLSKGQFSLEWLDANLVWNDMEGGRSVFIVSKEDSRQVIKWLQKHDFNVPSISD